MQKRGPANRFILALACACAGAGLFGAATSASGRGGAGGGGGNATPGREALTLSADEILPPEIKTSLGTMPGVKDLPVRQELPDVMTMNDGTKVTTPGQWAKRREEMKKILEYYAVGLAPPAPDNLKATIINSQDIGGGKYTYKLIHLTFGPRDKPTACSLDFGLWTPQSGPPVGVVICQDGSPPGATPPPTMPQGVNQGRNQDVFSKKLAPLPATDPVPGSPVAGGGSRGGRGAEGAVTNQVMSHGYAYVTYNSSDCAEDTTARFADGSFAFRHSRFFPAYPDYDWGVLRAWAWGASRIIDFLVTDPAIDKTKIAITGVSRNGKSSLIAGAFDDRITLVAPVASSGGGNSLASLVVWLLALPSVVTLAMLPRASSAQV